MPAVKLSQKLVDTATCHEGKPHTDYCDTELPGFMLKAQPSGKRSFYLRFKTAYGKYTTRHLLGAEAVSLKQARQRAKQYLSQLELGEDPFAAQKVRRQTTTLAAFIADSYLPHIKVSKKSWEVDEAMFRLHIVPVLGKLHLDQISKKHMVDLAAAHGQRHKPSSTNRMMNVLHRMFALALKWEIPGVTANPVAAVEKRKENNIRSRYLSDDELKALWAACDESESTALPYIFRMLLLTGARKTEVLQAKWQHIDWQQHQWCIPDNKSGRARYVPLSDYLIKMLRYLEKEKACDYILPNPETLKPYVNMYHAWNTARKKADLHDFRMHDLRHTAASYMVNNGIPLYIVKEILGHANYATTQRYSHLDNQVLINNSNRLANIVENTLLPLLDADMYSASD
ncbi:tyrosine-type recombinase/integrase [Vreelandella jeotgali]|uniref:tyrosine-type recombinase/integrase n=1 Tax=Vreelandella jeotgali TaxID=553386 RepID=UPI00034DE626|nr:site-specific integrase [Halomonas jeotgali]